MKTLLAVCLLCCAPALAAPVTVPVIVSARAPQGTAVGDFSSARAAQIVGAQSREVVRALQSNDTRALAVFVHPTRGVRFSPYIHVDTNRDRIVSRSQIAYLANHTRRWDWGDQDGEGGPMMMTWNDFRRRVLVPRAYLPGAREDFNRLSQNGNVPNNLNEIYPGAIFTRYYLAPTNGQYGDLDWRALFLAWRPVGEKWHLVGVANDQWTT